MKILLAASEASRVRRFYMPLLNKLRDIGGVVHLALGDLDADISEYLADVVLRFLCLSPESKGSGSSELAALLTNERYDVLICCGQSAANCCFKVLSRLRTKPSVVIVQDMPLVFDCFCNPFAKGLNKRNFKKLRSCTDLFLASNSADLITAQRLLPQTRCELVPATGLNLMACKPASLDTRNKAREALACTNDTFCIVTNGNAGKKGIGFLIDAMLYLPRIISLFVLEASELKTKLQRKITNLGLEDKVRLLTDSKTNDCLAAADLVIDASVGLGFSNMLATAQAMGIPVLANAARGNLDLVVSGHTGLTFSVGDLMSLVYGIRSMMYQQTLREYHADNAQKQLAKYDGEQMANRTIELIDSIYKIC